MIKFYTCCLVAFLFFFSMQPSKVFSQVGGGNTFEFLNLTPSARAGALGGSIVSIKDNDINLAFHNPSLLNSSMHHQLALNIVNYFADVKYGYAAYAHDFKKWGTYNLGVHYINYGEFQGALENGDRVESFKAGEYDINLGWGKQLNKMESIGLSSKLDSLFSIGINVKSIYSRMEQYSSTGVAADFATTFYHKKSEFSAALVIKNYGKQLTSYTVGNEEPLPFEIQFGISKKLAKAPLRVSLTARHLERYNLNYNDSSGGVVVDPFTNQPIPETTFDKFTNHADKFMRHIVVGAELLLSKNFHIRTGFNYQRRAELQVQSRTSVIGFSGGFGLRISKFHLSYGIASYHLTGSSHHFSLTTNLSGFWTKKNSVN